MTIASLTRSLARGTAALFAALFLMSALAACEEQGAAEKTGEAIDNAVEQTSEMVEDGAEKAEESLEQAEEKAE
jgi:pyridoxal/pyridoxine/pyridoxamine kinase